MRNEGRALFRPSSYRRAVKQYCCLRKRIHAYSNSLRNTKTKLFRNIITVKPYRDNETEFVIYPADCFR